MKRILKNEKGQATVEFALILPVLMVILMGIIEFGLMINGYLSITNASRDGARYASLGATDQVVATNVNTVLSHMDTTNISVNISPSYSYRDRGDMVTVEVIYNYDVSIPLISNIISDSVQLTSETTMRVE